MSFVHHYEMAALVNWAFCSVICLLCLGQLNSCRCRENKLDRARYALLLAGATASGMQPALFSTWPAWADVFMSGAVMAGLAINAVRWHLKDTTKGLA